MKYFKDPKNGDVYAYEADGSQDEFIKYGLEPMSDDEIYAHQHPTLTPEQIVELNSSVEAELSSSASLAMTPLFLSIQLGNATDSETKKAKEWQEYYRALKAVDLSSETPKWPVIPK